MPRPSQVLESLLNLLGRSLEMALTGQSDFRLTTSEFHSASTIGNPVQARLVLAEVRQELAEHFGIRLARPVLLELARPAPLGWKAAVFSHQANLGRYVPQVLGQGRAHQILVAPGLPRARFRAVLAHELAHAFQEEEGLFRGRPALREGMARWVEYHVLRRAGCHREARRLLRIRHYLFGKAVADIVRYEEQHGVAATMAWLRTQDAAS
ncbi:MAG TPA: hypothetical protein VNO81_14805 [Candidatus Nitrosotenuis sp.]|jgi:hypothetical protein|nr:hypothetical protein [Candidatus Nitrosotenuis sp.]